MGIASASTSTGTTAIQSSSYKLSYQIGSDTAELAEVKTVTVPESGSCKITLSATGTAGATGYCRVKVGNETYYTEQIFVDDTFTFTVNAAAGTKIILTPKWGTYSHTATIQDKGEIAAIGSHQSNTQEQNNIVTTEPTAPTTPTTLTAPSSSPTKSETTTPEPSATAPVATQPEPTDTEPTPAPETATPESTTAAQTEPPTTEESESN